MDDLGDLWDLDEEQFGELEDGLNDLEDGRFRELVAALCPDPVEREHWLIAMSPEFMPLLAVLVGPVAKAVIAKGAITTLAEIYEARGEVRGRAAALLELLTDRFGAAAVGSVEEAVRAADIDRLTLWNRRVPSADSLEAVLV
ncbi:hypothetical protein NRB20_62040 [Nocardia sp. RB20]|uniref:Uncharacterized protein n=1 Tax=Nocardia macrotermitis TaxID=2585198 RepID=A0A7K0DBG7_9NOCA|nr:hypothetical protein [Nocardia macrotermitis]